MQLQIVRAMNSIVPVRGCDNALDHSGDAYRCAAPTLDNGRNPGNTDTTNGPYGRHPDEGWSTCETRRVASEINACSTISIFDMS